MEITATALRQLHRIHSQLADLRGRLARGPQQIRARQANVTNLESQWSASRELVQNTKIIADQKQLDLKANELKIADWKDRLNSCSSNKEYQTLLEQIAAAEMAGSVLTDEILEALEAIDELEKLADEAKQLVDSGNNELAKCRHKVESETSVIQGDIVRLESELASEEQQLPVSFREDYGRVIRCKGADGMAEVADQVCQGCGQQITLNMQNNLQLSKPIFCLSCGCLLYLGE
jgi:uncharacterized protein